MIAKPLIALAGVALVLSSAIELARGADKPVYKALPAKAYSHDWMGLYFGLHGGFAWGDKDFSGRINGVATNLGGHDLSGLLGGFQVGYNYQFAGTPWVAGVEFQASFANLDGNHSTGRFTVTGLSTEVNALYALSGRFGYAFDHSLVYAKAGVALADEEHVIAPVFVGNPPAASADYTRTGLLLGVGYERSFLGNWSAKIEYNYMDFFTHAPAFACIDLTQCGPGVSLSVEQSMHLFQVGLNYRWGQGLMARR